MDQSYSPGGAHVYLLVVHVSWAEPNPHTERHLDRFSRFFMSRDRDRPTDRQTDHATPSVTIGRIYVILRCGLIVHCVVIATK